MKTLQLSILLTFCFLNSFSQQKVVITGKVSNPLNDKVKIEISNIDNEPIVSKETKLDKKGVFHLTFDLLNADIGILEIGEEYSKLFLTPGDSLYITLNAKEFDETISFKGKGAEANNYLAKKLLWMEEPKNDISALKWDALKTKDEGQFIKYSDSIQQVLLSYFKKNKSDKFSESFNDFEQAEIIYGSAEDKMNYHGLHAYLNKLKTKVLIKDPKYYDFTKKMQIQNEAALNVREYRNFIVSYINKNVKDSLFKNDTVFDQKKLALFSKAKFDFAKKNLKGNVREAMLATIIKDHLNYNNDLPNADILIMDYKSINPSSDQIEKINKIYTLKETTAKGKPAINFSYPDLSGKQVSLSDLKGKYVYVDLWASWCGPCKRELPYSKKLIEKFKDKDVYFVFLSVDEVEADWRKAVEKEEIKGINLIAKEGFKAEVMKNYGITGIPRYLLIDRNGNIISSNADRPSGGIEKEIEELLKQ